MKKSIIALILLLSLMSFSVTKIVYSDSTIWACSNHEPAHIASDTQELQTLTQQYKCSGWYIVSP